MNLYFSKSKIKSEGFVLLVALLTASFLLAVGLGVSSLAIRGFQLTSNTTESIKALYAANAGIECALYWDLKEGSDPFKINPDSGTQQDSGGTTLKCAVMKDLATGDLIDPNNAFSTDNVDSVSSNPVWFWLSFRTKLSHTDSSGDGPCAYVTIKKAFKGASSNNQITTVIDSYGYNVHGRRSDGELSCATGNGSNPVVSSPAGRVERLLEATY